MATDTTKRAYGPAFLSNIAGTTLYTVGAAAVQVIKEVRVMNETASAAKFTLRIGTDVGGKSLYKDVSVAANSLFVDQCWTVLGNSDAVIGYSDTASALTITISVVETA